METQSIGTDEQRCISRCVFDHWSEDSGTRSEDRDAAYERCLTDCRICS